MTGKKLQTKRWTDACLSSNQRIHAQSSTLCLPDFMGSTTCADEAKLHSSSLSPPTLRTTIHNCVHRFPDLYNSSTGYGYVEQVYSP